MFFKKKKNEEVSNEQIAQQFEKIKPSIYPITRPDYTVITQEVQTNDGTKELTKVHKKYFGDFTIFYQIDCGDVWEVLLQENVPESLSLEEIDMLAFGNLVNHFRCELILSTQFLGYEVYGDVEMLSSSILIGSLWENVATRLQDNIIVAIPARDTVLFVEESKKEIIEEMRQLAVDIYESNEKQVSQLLYKFDPETGFSVYA